MLFRSWNYLTYRKKDFDERKNKNLNEPPLVLRKEIKGLNKESKVTKNTNFENLNKELLILKQENKELKGEVLNIKRDKDSYLKKIDEKIEFYREENEKIIVDKSDIQKKLENTKSQLRMNENNKRELRIALDNLNKKVSLKQIKNEILDFDEERLKALLLKHVKNTNSNKGKQIINNWSNYLSKFIKVVPNDFKEVLLSRSKLGNFKKEAGKKYY